MKRHKPNKKSEQLHELIVRELEDLGIDTDLLSISVEKGSKVVIDGQIYSHKDKELMTQAILEDVGIDEFEDYTVVMDGIQEESSVNGETFENVDDLEEESFGTEDIYKSIEDGEPYIPPISHIYSELSQTIRWKKKKKNNV